MNHRARAETFREDNGWPWCGECELDDSCHGCEIGLRDLAAAFAEVEAEALDRAERACEKLEMDYGDEHDASCESVTIREDECNCYLSEFRRSIRAIKEKP